MHTKWNQITLDLIRQESEWKGKNVKKEEVALILLVYFFPFNKAWIVQNRTNCTKHIAFASKFHIKNVSIFVKTKNKQKTFEKILYVYVYIFDPLKSERYDSKSNFQPESTKNKLTKTLKLPWKILFCCIFTFICACTNVWVLAFSKCLPAESFWKPSDSKYFEEHTTFQWN